MKKNQNGITLIALVITIIVLLILAGVSIAMLTGDNGILNQATRARTDTAEAEVADRINMALNGEFANLLADGSLSGTTQEAIQKANGLDSDYTCTIKTESLTSGGEVLTITKGTKTGSITYVKETGKYTIQKAEYPDGSTAEE